MRSRVSLVLVSALFACTLVFVPSVLGSHAVVGPNVKVTDDNNNVDGGLNNVTPSKDAQNRQSNETSVAISGRPSPVTGQVGDIVVDGANDYRMVPHTTDTWLGFHLSFNGGTTWFGAPPFPNGFNTMVPGFVTDTSPQGLASPLLGLDGAGDPVVRFDRQGNLLVGGIAFNRNRDPGERPLDTVGFVARYNFTPGTPATASTPTSAGSPPHFTYAGTAIVDRGAVGFAVPSGFAGNFTDKPWMEVDLNAVGEPVLGQRLLRRHELPRPAGQLADRVQPLDRRRRDVVVAADDLDRRPGRVPRTTRAPTSRSRRTGRSTSRSRPSARRASTRSTSSSRPTAAGTGRSRWSWTRSSRRRRPASRSGRRRSRSSRPTRRTRTSSTPRTRTS